MQLHHRRIGDQHVSEFLDERGRRIWAATESRAIGYGGDALVAEAAYSSCAHSQMLPVARRKERRAT